MRRPNIDSLTNSMRLSRLLVEPLKLTVMLAGPARMANSFSGLMSRTTMYKNLTTQLLLLRVL